MGGVLHNCKGKFLLMFCKNLGVCDYNEAEVLTILEALRLFSRRYHGRLVVESDCLVRLLRRLNERRLLGNFITIAMKLGRYLQILVFILVIRLDLQTICMVDALAK